MNLISVLNEIKKQALEEKATYEVNKKQLEQEHEERLKELQSAYNVNLELNTACLNCEGTGKEDYSDGGGYGSRVHKTTCNKCNGTGVINKIK